MDGIRQGKNARRPTLCRAGTGRTSSGSVVSPPRRRPWTQGPRRRTGHSWNGCGLCLEVQCDPSRARSREAEAASARRRLRGAQIAAVRTCILRLLFFSTCGARTRGDREHNRLQGSEPPSDWPRERGSCAARRGAGLSRLYLAANRNPRNPELPALYRSQPAPIARGAITIASASGPKAPPRVRDLRDAERPYALDLVRADGRVKATPRSTPGPSSSESVERRRRLHSRGTEYLSASAARARDQSERADSAYVCGCSRHTPNGSSSCRNSYPPQDGSADRTATGPPRDNPPRPPFRTGRPGLRRLATRRHGQSERLPRECRSTASAATAPRRNARP